MIDQKLERERAFHNALFDDSESERSRRVEKFYAITTSFAVYRKRVRDGVEGKQVLEYGCGPGSLAFDIAAWGGIPTGIDLSEVAIDQARAEAAERKLEGAEFLVMNAEELDFEDRRFDRICGSAILHHLDLNRAFRELTRMLKPDGKAVFIEPLGHNPLINLYRRLTPRLRTVDEHPLLMRDLRLAEKYFGKVDCQFFQLQTLMAVPFRNTPLIGPLSRTLEAADRFAFKVAPPLRRFAWQVVIEFSQPRPRV